MGLAERFKDKLENKNIFEGTTIENDFEKKDIKFISKPITEVITVQPQKFHSGSNSSISDLNEFKVEPSELSVAISAAKFENLETEIIAKIRKTPYWEEFSTSRQENMIRAYFEKKCSAKCPSAEKEEFVSNVLALANSR